MGIVFQKSAKLALDAKARRRLELKKDSKNGKLAPSTRRKLMQRREAEFNSLVEEARIWMYAMILPTNIIANGDMEITQKLDDTIRELTVKLLGRKIDHDKVNRVCGRIARNILIPGPKNYEEGTMNFNYPPIPPWEQVQDLLDDRDINASMLDRIYQECEDFQRLYPNVRTWRDVREALVELELQLTDPDNISVDWFDGQQRNYTYREIGVPGEWHFSGNDMEKFIAMVRSEDPAKIKKCTKLLIDFDQVFVRRMEDPVNQIFVNGEVIASIHPDDNIMNLHPPFYQGMNATSSLRDLPIIPGQSSLRHGLVTVQVLLHEIIHSASILRANDHKFRYFFSGDIDNLNLLEVIRTPADAATEAKQGYTEVWSYGLEACLALVRRDERDNTNRAEDNADSWAYYFLLRMLILLYPEIDILAALDTPDPLNLPDRVMHRRESNLHHCSLFEPLRSREPLTSEDRGPIRNDLAAYEPYKDKWSGFFGHKPPRSTEQILDVLKQYAHRQEKKSEKKGKKRLKNKLKLQARKEIERVRKEEEAKARAEAEMVSQEAEKAALTARADRIRRIGEFLKKRRARKRLERPSGR